MTAVLDQLFSNSDAALKQAADEALVAFDVMVRDIADGATPDAPTLLAVLDAAGKTRAQLKADVELQLFRRKDAEAAESIPKLESGIHAADAELADIRMKCAKAVAEFNAQEQAAADRQSILLRRHTAALTARHRLLQTAPSRLIAREKALNDQAADLNRQKTAAAEHLFNLRRQEATIVKRVDAADEALSMARSSAPDKRKAKHAGAVKAKAYLEKFRVEKLEAAQQRIDALAVDIAKIDRSIAQVLKEKLLP